MNAGTMIEPDLNEAIARVRGGDLEAFSSIVETYQQDLLASIAFRLPDRSLTEEIAQRTFIHAYEHLDQFVPGTDFGAWLRAIARNIARAELKRYAQLKAGRGRYRDYIRHALLKETAATGPDDEERERLLERVRSCLAKLPETWKSLVEGHYFSRKPVRLLSQELGRTVTWVTTALLRARRAVKACLETSGGGEDR